MNDENRDRNSSSSGPRFSVDSIEEDFDIFDSLPIEAKNLLRYAPANFSATEIAGIIIMHGLEPTMRAVLRGFVVDARQVYGPDYPLPTRWLDAR